MTQLVNDVHSRLNPTAVARIEHPGSLDALRGVVRAAGLAREPMCIAGARHAMGGQQFRAGAVLVDTTGMRAVEAFDSERGRVTVQSGAHWRDVVAAIRGRDEPGRPLWGIRQKQTGADDLTLGGSVSCNAHGRGLAMGPIVEDVERLTLVDARGEVLVCSREENPELFSLVVGGYGLFGVVADVTLRLVERRPLRRLVDIIDIDDAINAVYRRAAQGCIYGDFQYAIDPAEDSFLRRGVFACYEPVPEGTPISDESADLDRGQWLELLRMAHTDKRKAFQLYAQHYLATHGRVYWSDTMQLGVYIPSYAEFLARAGATAGTAPESLMITELFVPPARLLDFMAAARVALLDTGVEDIYGTIRSVRKDQTTFLPWAREDFGCVIFNLRTVHTEAGIARSAQTSRRLIDAAAALGGSFYLTYHRWATREQLLACHPRLPEFLEAKHRYDPSGQFQSDWHQHLVHTVGGP
jgi:FAD/FMN-containing dehydrogenase